MIYLLCLVVLGASAWCGHLVVRRSRRRRAAWTSGVTAPARVVRAHVRNAQGPRGTSGQVRYHDYAFATADGITVRFTEGGGPARDVGDRLTVYYPPGRPDWATAAAPAPRREAAVAVVTLLLLLAANAAMGVALVLHHRS
ncbi:DUF3592 domain-containing protein [Streptomyces sp. JJ38]|uniref:DUF3592 domain-containing protein n=1 Tax=Streptomyces sp. JJ38 TaxID=2738128 RepID=UPI001C5801BB|nr:DUF3592 domain-containing protein [Streptomyces sp. JJ38]MBW1596172.1 DUF3592 domain-containing protein [Streptomyces sp. JJ38]